MMVNLYSLARHKGVFIAFILHWAMYFYALYNNYADNGYNYYFNSVIQKTSGYLLSIFLLIMFYFYKDDCNTKFLPICIATLTLRVIIEVFRIYGLENSGIIMIVSLFFIILLRFR